MNRLALAVEASTATQKALSGWWDELNGSTQWQDGVFYFLCAAYALVSAIALVRLKTHAFFSFVAQGCYRTFTLERFS